MPMTLTFKPRYNIKFLLGSMDYKIKPKEILIVEI
jgi:hypothetical protein